MIESEDSTDPNTGLPVISLYSSTREPPSEVVDRVDAILVDLQDVGTRIYTFAYTMANCMRAAKRAGKKVIVLDRPNPIGGRHIEGNVLEPEYSSFVGQFPISVRHGLTMGELALLFNDAFDIGCDLDVVKLPNWKRKNFADDLTLEWVPPSPNLPTFLSALTFPGSVLFEGTNISEGRGTTKPMEHIGAPFIDADLLAKMMNQRKLPGVYFRPIYFQPTYQKHMDKVCGGVHIHVLNKNKFMPFNAGLLLLSTIATLYPNDFTWKQPPYEYEHDRMPIDLIAGSALLREGIDSGKGTRAFEQKAVHQLEDFRKLRKDYLLYD